MQIVNACVTKNLAACGHIEKVNSIYSWQGEVHEKTEWRVLLKTVAASYQAIEALIVSLHSYEEPAVLAIPVSHGRRSYLDWIEAHSS